MRILRRDRGYCGSICQVHSRAEAVVSAKTPDAVIVKLHETYVAAVADPVVRQKVIDMKSSMDNFELIDLKATS